MKIILTLKRVTSLIEKRKKILIILIISFYQQLYCQNKLLFKLDSKTNVNLIENTPLKEKILTLNKNVGYLFFRVQSQFSHGNKNKLPNINFKNKLIIIGFFLFFLTSSYFIIYYYKSVFSERLRELDTHKEGLLKKEEKLEQKIDFRNKQLISYAFNFQQKNEIINKVFSLARGLEKTSSSTEEQQLIKELINIGKENLHVDKEWEHFKFFFEETLSGLHSKLVSKHPDLNANDLKICSLIRLNLSIKEAANILNISPGSLKTARYRLRKKLKLKSGQKIIDYVIKIEREELC